MLTIRLRRVVLIWAIVTPFFMVNSQEQHSSAIAKTNYHKTEEQLIARSSGGRSGGGSFKKRSSDSSSPRNSRPTRNSSPNTSPRNYTTPQPTYNTPPRNNSPSNYTYRSRNSNNQSVFIVGFFFLMVFGLIGFIIFNQRSRKSSNNQQSDQERDNNIVTISKLQIALLADATGVQKDLSELSLNINTDSYEGLVDLLRESVLVLLRNSDYWDYVGASSESINIDKAESAFEKLSIIERSKFNTETLSNIEGKIRQQEIIQPDENDIAAYIVVTLILGTADDQPLFGKIHSHEELQSVLENLASMREDYLMKLELLWSPQTEADSLTYDELLTEYTDLIKLV